MNYKKKLKEFKKNSEKVLVNLRKKYAYNKKIKTLIDINKISKLTSQEDILDYWSRFGVKVNTSWHRVYAHINNIDSPKYIPETVFYNKIEPTLNDARYLIAFTDKNNYSKTLPFLKQPQTLIKMIRSSFYNHQDHLIDFKEAKKLILKHEGKLIIKPSVESGGGKGIGFIEVKNDKIFEADKIISFDELVRKYNKDFIIQKLVNQYEHLKKIYPHSLNTLRIMTLKHGLDIHVLSTVVRFGNNGSSVDNQSSGGVSCGVSPQGELQDFAVDKFGKKFKFHPYTSKSFKGVAIPNFKNILNELKEAHKNNPYFNLISWDIALDETGSPVLIELNLRNQEINFHQMNNGPLLGEFTDDVMVMVTQNSQRTE